jgi:hypothetical protein
MKLIETTVSATTVRMRYADDADSENPGEWLEFEVKLASLVNPSDTKQPLGDPELQFLAEVRRAALRYVRDAIGEETQRLAGLANQNF